MDLEKPRLARLTAIITQLQSGRLITARTLAERHGVSLRTIYRDIRTLERSGVPVVTEEGKGYSLLEGYRLPPVMFTEAEANALITAERLLSVNKDGSLATTYHSAITKIKAALPRAARERSELLADRLQTRDNPTKIATSDLLMRFQSAITSQQLVDIDYLSYADKPTKRQIEPFALVTTKGNWVGIAYCRLRQDFRAFRLDRIVAFRERAQQFKPHEISLEEYFERSRKKYIPTLDIPLSQATANFTSSTKQTTMEKLTLPSFKLIGITIRTSNAKPEQTAKDIGGLWNRLMAESLIAQIPNKVDTTVYSAYTDFESDHTGEYTTLLGCRVNSFDQVPEGMETLEIAGGSFQKMICRGDLSQGVVYGAWATIWEMDLERNFVTDFEVYGPKALNPSDAEVEIFVGVQ